MARSERSSVHQFLSGALLAAVFSACTASVGQAADITSCEFSWDVEPRPGVTVRSVTPGSADCHVCSEGPPGPRDYSVCDISLDIPLTDAKGNPLTSGVHTLWLRSCDADGCGPWTRRRHCIPRPDDWRIVGGEWFFVEDERLPDRAPQEPPCGSGKPLELEDLSRCESQANDPLAWIDLELETPPLPGTHSIGFRLLDSEGVCGPTRWKTVVIPPPCPMVSGVYLTASGPLPGACTPTFVRPDPTLPDIPLELEVEPEPGEPRCYSAEIDLASLGIEDLAQVPLFVRAECATGATFVLVPESSAEPPVTFLRGNCDGNAPIELTDAVFVLNWLFLGGPLPDCLAACNTNDDATLDITDGVYLLNYLFLNGTPPPHPHPECGRLDRDDLAIGCETPPPDCSALCEGP